QERPSREFVLDRTVVERLKRARSNEERRTALRPTVVQQILVPRFADMNRSWQGTSAKTISEKTKVLLKKLEVVQWYPQESVLALQQSLERLGVTASKLEFRAPKDQEWWTSVPGKTGTILAIQESALKELALDHAQDQASTLFDAMD